jgi:hypothetical protein
MSTGGGGAGGGGGGGCGGGGGGGGGASTTGLGGGGGSSGVTVTVFFVQPDTIANAKETTVSSFNVLFKRYLPMFIDFRIYTILHIII